MAEAGDGGSEGVTELLRRSRDSRLSALLIMYLHGAGQEHLICSGNAASSDAKHLEKGSPQTQQLPSLCLLQLA